MRPRAVKLALTLESIILLVFAAGWYLVHDASPTTTTTAALIVLSALAMGVQSAAVNRLDISGVATTYVTGTLAKSGSEPDGAVATSRRKSKPVFRHSAVLVAVWIVYIGGAVIAAVDLPRNPLLALMLPTALIMVVVVIAALAFRPR